MSGKGSRQRDVDPASFAANWDRIFPQPATDTPCHDPEANIPSVLSGPTGEGEHEASDNQGE